MNGSFLPEDRLLEEELAQRIGVSRTSIRDSLRRSIKPHALMHSHPFYGWRSPITFWRLLHGCCLTPVQSVHSP
ncbi:GntR family transcriptional regulator, partial [Limnohabitans sp.]|uniref:GntR family transcriptional regulator n=1 Tax=Limnohabitans sp. TaxID=1907725 RepID=UPI0037BF3D6D